MRTKAFNLYSSHLKKIFGGRVNKISVDAGFGCPNRDGGRTNNGCIFCDPSGSGAVGIDRSGPIQEQIESSKKLMRRKYRAKWFIPYFQPFTNTYAPVEVLRDYYDQALASEDVVGLAVGTRPDCLPDAVLDLLEEYHRKTYFWLEIGLQSIHDKSLEYLNRGHDYACFLDAYQRAKKRDINICVHVILGLPGETHEEILATAREMARLKVDGIKLHLLHILEGTRMGEMFKAGEIEMLSMDEYVKLVVDFIELLPPETIIQRLTGDGPRDMLLAPAWSLNKWEVLNAIDDELERRKSWQGKKYCEEREEKE
jgi:radical SAM protein (TIGR01212 family)